METHFWIGVASREHVLRGKEGGFAQVCHGNAGPLKRMRAGDWIAYYSPTERFGEKKPCRRFTAIGQILEGEPYQVEMAPRFVPWRRNVAFFDAEEVEIVPLIESLSFIKDVNRWGFPFRRGCFSVSLYDFQLIARGMGVKVEMQ